MSTQVLVATMNQDDYSLVEKMNIQTDAIIGNQCNRNSVETFDYKNKKIVYLNFFERGVGLNRNNCLLRSNSDYCVIADDDMVFYDNYSDTIKMAFEKMPKADFLIFNIDENGQTDRRKNKKFRRLNIFNYLNYGAARFVFKRDVIQRKAITFNLNFGGGTQHSCGEDSLFLRDCLSKKVRIYTAPYSIALLTDDRKSSWFEGYNQKYFYDKGYFLGVAHPKLCRLFSIYILMTHKEYFKAGKITKKQAIRSIKEGIKDSKKF